MPFIFWINRQHKSLVPHPAPCRWKPVWLLPALSNNLSFPIRPRAGGNRFGYYQRSATISRSPSGPVPVETGLATTSAQQQISRSPSGPVPVETGLATTSAQQQSLVPHPAPCRWKPVWLLPALSNNLSFPIRPRAGGNRFGYYQRSATISRSPSGPVPVETGLATTSAQQQSLVPHPAPCRWKPVWLLPALSNNLSFPIRPRAGGNRFGYYQRSATISRSPSGPVPVETGLATTSAQQQSLVPHPAPCRWKPVWLLRNRTPVILSERSNVIAKFIHEFHSTNLSTIVEITQRNFLWRTIDWVGNERFGRRAGSCQTVIHRGDLDGAPVVAKPLSTGTGPGGERETWSARR